MPCSPSTAGLLLLAVEILTHTSLVLWSAQSSRRGASSIGYRGASTQSDTKRTPACCTRFCDRGCGSRVGSRCCILWRPQPGVREAGWAGYPPGIAAGGRGWCHVQANPHGTFDRKCRVMRISHLCVGWTGNLLCWMELLVCCNIDWILNKKEYSYGLRMTVFGRAAIFSGRADVSCDGHCCAFATLTQTLQTELGIHVMLWLLLISVGKTD